MQPGTNPLNQIDALRNDAVRKLQAKGISSLRQFRSLKPDERSEILRTVFDSTGRKQAIKSINTFLTRLPTFFLKDISVDMQVDKKTGIPYGKLAFDFIIKYEESYQMKSDTKTGFSVMVGSPIGHYLLCQKSIPLQTLKSIEQKVELNFEWAKANANAGPDGGIIIIRIMYEAYRGLDVEYKIPLQRKN